MATAVQKLIGTSEEDDEEEMEMDVKEEEEEDDDDDEDGERQISKHVIVGVDGRVFSNSAATARLQQHQPVQDQVGTPGGGSRRSRPLEEKERTKLRERNRRAITARILAGLRRHGNYNLRVRADINDVIAALAREAGWVVLPDGTTFPSKSQGQRPNTGSSSGVNISSQMIPQQTPPTCLKGSNSTYQGLADYNACQTKDAFVPNTSPYDLASNARSQSSSMMGDGGHLVDVHAHISGSLDEADGKQIVDLPSKLVEPDFSGSPYIPVYVMLPLGIINMKCELVDSDGLLKHLKVLKSANVDGIIVDCWWGIVEAHTPLEYNWNGYRRLFLMVRELKLKLQVVMAFHECGGNVGDDVCIPLPHWVAEIGRSNPDIFFTDREGRHNPECLSWGVDRERVLKGRTALESVLQSLESSSSKGGDNFNREKFRESLVTLVEGCTCNWTTLEDQRLTVYFDYMKSFRMEFNEFFENGDISMIEVGLGPRGELRYPSCPVRHGWRYPGIGEFQCYDQYLLKSLRKAADARGHAFWARIPDNAGSYDSQPHETNFFCDGGDYDSYYGRFFLNWYSQVLVNHGEQVLYLAKLAFDGVCVAAKLSGIHWWYKTASHAAEITSGFYNSSNRDGYASIMKMLKTHGVALIFSSSELPMLDQHEDFSDALSDADALVWQVMNSARDVCIPIISENAAPCFDRVGYNKVLANAKPLNDPDGRHFFSFTYLRLSPNLMERKNFTEFKRFVERMHGEGIVDPQV